MGCMTTNFEQVGEHRRRFLPAAGHDWFLPLYDPFVKLLGGDCIRRQLIDQATLQPGQRALDIGCGTGTLAVMMKQLHPEVDVVGLDPDPKALARARRKAKALAVRFDQGFADALPYAEASFERVFSSFMLHHLAEDEKARTLREVRRVLRPGGSLHLVDFGDSESRGGLFALWAHSSHRLRGNSEERILMLMRQAELADAMSVGRGAMLFGHMAYCYYRS